MAVSEVGDCLLGTDLHVLGGYVAGVAHSTIHLVLDTTSMTWRTAAPLPERLDHVVAVAVPGVGAGRVYAIGGYDATGHPTTHVWIYDPGADTWSAGPPLPLARAAGTGQLLAGRIHLVGGVAPGGDTGEQDVLDPAAGGWTTAAPVPGPRDHAASAVVGGLLHVAGGRPGGMTSHEVYDPGTDRWTAAAPLPAGRSSIAGVAFGGRFLVLGGEDAAETSASTRVDGYAPATGAWTRGPDLPTPRQGIGAVVLSGPTGETVLEPGGAPSAGGSEQTSQLLVLSTVRTAP